MHGIKEETRCLQQSDKNMLVKAACHGCAKKHYTISGKSALYSKSKSGKIKK